MSKQQEQIFILLLSIGTVFKNSFPPCLVPSSKCSMKVELKFYVIDHKDRPVELVLEIIT